MHLECLDYELEGCSTGYFQGKELLENLSATIGEVLQYKLHC